MVKKKKYKKSFKIRKKKSIFKNRFFWLSALILIGLGAIFYFLIFSSFFQIKEIRISGNKKVLAGDIKAIITEQINKKILFLDSQNIFLIDFEKIHQKLLERFPQIDEVNLKRKFPDIVETNIKEREAIGIWCQTEKCFYLDKKGVIFEEGTEGAKLIIKSEIEEAEIFLGKEVFEKNHIEAILEIQRNLIEQLDIKIKEFVISQDKKKLTVKTTEAWEIYFSLKEDVSEQIFNLDLVLKEKIPPEGKGNLEYINLRFGNRVYIKYKETEELVDVVNKD